MLHYGFPMLASIVIREEILNELCSLAGVQKSRDTSYHAMRNGMTERFNQTLLNMLGTL